MFKFRGYIDRAKFLYSVLKNPVKVRRIIKSFNQNWGLRILALVMAIGIWAYVTNTKTKANLNIKAPIKFITAENVVARAFTIGGQSRSLTNIVLRLSCSDNNKKLLENGDYQVEVDLKGEKAGNIITEHTVSKKKIKYIGKYNDDLKNDVVINAFSPSKFRIETDLTRQKLVQVIATVIGKPREGFTIVSKDVFPTAIIVSGPARVVDALESVMTEPINVEGMSKKLEGEYKVITSDMDITIPKSLVTVQIGVNTKSIQKTFASVKIKQFGTAENGANVKFMPPIVNVTLEGQKDIVDLITPLDINAWVDVDNYPIGKNVLPVKLIIPANCSIVEISPSLVTNLIGIIKEH